MAYDIETQAEMFTRYLHLEIREWMKRRGLNQRMLAEKSGINKDRLSRAVYRQLSPIDIRELDLISKALEVDPISMIRVAEAKVKAAEAVADAEALVLQEEERRERESS